MNREKSLLGNYTVFDLVIIAIISSLGIATKPIIVPLVHILTGPLFIPGGAIAGGIGYVKKIGTGTLIGVVQSILVIASGAMGTHGIMSIISYTCPGIVADLVFLVCRNKKYTVMHYIFGCMAANITGTAISNLLFFRLPSTVLLLLFSSAALSGAIGGLIASNIVKSLESMKLNI